MKKIILFFLIINISFICYALEKSGDYLDEYLKSGNKSSNSPENPDKQVIDNKTKMIDTLPDLKRVNLVPDNENKLLNPNLRNAPPPLKETRLKQNPPPEQNKETSQSIRKQIRETPATVSYQKTNKYSSRIQPKRNSKHKKMQTNEVIKEENIKKTIQKKKPAEHQKIETAEALEKIEESGKTGDLDLSEYLIQDLSAQKNIDPILDAPHKQTPSRRDLSDNSLENSALQKNYVKQKKYLSPFIIFSFLIIITILIILILYKLSKRYVYVRNDEADIERANRYYREFVSDSDKNNIIAEDIIKNNPNEFKNLTDKIEKLRNISKHYSGRL